MSKRTIAIISGLILAAAAGFAVHHWTRRPPAAPAVIANFSLLDHTGVSHDLYREYDAQAVVLIAYSGQDSSTAIAAPLVNDWIAKYPRIRFFWVNPDAQQTRDAVRSDSSRINNNTPVLMDPFQIVTQLLGLKHAGEAVVVETAGWTAVYRGPADGKLGSFLEELSAGRSPPAANFPSTGKTLELKRASETSYTRDIAPIVMKRCLWCHAGVYPEALNSYHLVAAAAPRIQNSLLLGKMPPFTADRAYGPYLNDPGMTATEQRLLYQWIELGMPKDDGDDPLLSYNGLRYRLLSERRAIRKPIYSVEMDSPAKIPAAGDREYQYFQLGGPVPRDMWIEVIHVSTSNRPQLRQAAVFVLRHPLSHYKNLALHGDFPDRCYDATYYMLGAFEPEVDHDPHFNRVIAWSPDRSQPARLPHPNTTVFIPKGYYLVLESMRRGAGKETEEKTKVDFYGDFKNRGARPVHSAFLRSREINIPPGRKSHIERTNRRPIDRPIAIIGMMAHMHLRGRAVRLIERRPNGEERILASIPNYHYGMLTNMSLIPASMVPVAAGSELMAECEFDSSPYTRAKLDTMNPIRLGMTQSGSEMSNFNLGYIFRD